MKKPTLAETYSTARFACFHEAVSLLQVLLGWIAGLPILLVCILGVTIWERLVSLIPPGPIKPAGDGMSPVTA